MKCPICGKEVELLRKQVGIDKMGEPVFNEYAVCRDCKKQWNLDKQRAKKQVQESLAQPGKKEPIKEEKAVSEEVKAQDTTKIMQKPVSSSGVVEKKDEISGKKDEKSNVVKPTDEKSEILERKPELKKRPAGERPAPKNRTAEKGKISEEKRDVSERKAESKKKPVGERPVSKKKITEKKEVSEEEKVRRPKTKNPDVSGKVVPRNNSKRVSDNRKKPEAREGNEGKERVGNSRPRRRRPDEEPKYSNLPPEQVRAKKEKAVRQAYREMQVLDEEYGRRRKKRAETEDKRFAEKKRMDSGTNHQARFERKEEKPPFGLIRIFIAVVSLAAFGYFAYHGAMGMLNNISMASDSKVGLTSVILAGCMLISAILLLVMRKKHTIFAFLLPMVAYIGGAVYTFLNRENDKILLYGVIAAVAFGGLMLILGGVSRIGEEEEDYED